MTDEQLRNEELPTTKTAELRIRVSPAFLAQVHEARGRETLTSFVTHCIESKIEEKGNPCGVTYFDPETEVVRTLWVSSPERQEQEFRRLRNQGYMHVGKVWR